MTTLFIADLHLNHEQPTSIELFLQLLRGRAAQAEALYILGDLFEAWLGDDLILPDYRFINQFLNTETAFNVFSLCTTINKIFNLACRAVENSD